MASLAVNSVVPILRQFGIERERQHARDQIDLLLGQHRLHGRERRLDHGVVALVLEPVLVQHRPHGDVDGAAVGIGGDDLALEVLDLLDRTVGEHDVTSSQ